MVPLDELEGLAFCQGLAPEYLYLIARTARLQEHLPGTVLFREGYESPYVYVLLQGEVDLEVEVPGEGPLSVQAVEAGELLGWSSALWPGPMTATARTLTRCRLAALAAADLRALSRQDPAFGAAFLRRTAAALAQRLHATRVQLLQARCSPRPDAWCGGTATAGCKNVSAM
jgi:CRP-like cAMP-binding protein